MLSGSADLAMLKGVSESLAGLRAFSSAASHCIAALLAYNGAEMVELGERLWAVPVDLLLS